MLRSAILLQNGCSNNVAYPDPDVCDKLAFEMLSYESLEQISKSKEKCQDIYGFYYYGTLKDSFNVVIGPDYSFLFASSFVDKEVHLSGYKCGLRSDLQQVRKTLECTKKI